jgi:large subunit ribosomal protein L25
MSELTITGEIRKELGKKVTSLRREGKVPGVYYGHGQQNIPITLSELTLRPLYKTSTTHIINLKLDDGSAHTCVLRDIQFDPLTDRPIHFDLYGISADEELTIEVPVVLKGTPKGVKDGGTIQHILHRLRVSCLPRYIPDHIELDVEPLEINRSIHVSEITLPNVRILESESSTIVAVVPPTVIKEPTPAEAVAETAAPAEPEVIGKGKKAEEAEGEEEESKE